MASVFLIRVIFHSFSIEMVLQPLNDLIEVVFLEPLEAHPPVVLAIEILTFLVHCTSRAFIEQLDCALVTSIRFLALRY